MSTAKAQFDESINSVAHGVTCDNLDSVPVKQWRLLAEEAETGWLKSFFNKRKINSEAVSIGISKIDDYSIFDQIEECQKLKKVIEQKLVQLEDYPIWMGWSTEPRAIDGKAEIGLKVRQCLSALISLTDEPAEILIPAKKWFVDGREFLAESKLYATSEAYLIAMNEFSIQNDDISSMGLDIEANKSLISIDENFNDIASNANKLKNWCEWQSAKQKVAELNLQILASKLENGEIDYKELSEQFRCGFCAWLAPLLIVQYTQAAFSLTHGHCAEYCHRT